MPTVRLGNESVVEHVKPDEGTNESVARARKDLGQRVTTMSVNEVDGEDRESRAMNLSMVVRLWDMHSDKPPAWVESDDELLEQLVAGQFGCPQGRPKSWKEDQ